MTPDRCPACADLTAPCAACFAGVEVRVSPYVDGVPLETRCRLARLRNSPTRGVLFVTAAELAAIKAAATPEPR